MQHITTSEPGSSGTKWLFGGIGVSGSCALRLVDIQDQEPAGLKKTSVDRTIFVKAGTLKVRIGTDSYEAESQSLIFLPAGTPHAVAALGERAEIVDIFTPTPDNPPFSDAPARPVPDSAALVRPLDRGKFSKGGFAYQSMLDRSSGSNHLRVNIVEVQPGSGSPDWHIHSFDQFYFILSGEMQIEIGRRRFVAEAGNLVYLPAGIVHRNYNAGPGQERHITLLVPEPENGAIFDYACTIHETEAKIMEVAPVPNH